MLVDGLLHRRCMACEHYRPITMYVGHNRHCRPCREAPPPEPAKLYTCEHCGRSYGENDAVDRRGNSQTSTCRSCRHDLWLASQAGKGNELAATRLANREPAFTKQTVLPRASRAAMWGYPKRGRRTKT